VADSLEDLLDLGHEPIVVDWSSKLDDAKVSRTFSHVFFAGITLEVAVDRAEMGVVRTFLSGSEALLIHGLCIGHDVRKKVLPRPTPGAERLRRLPTRILNIDHGQTLGFLCREQSKLYLLDRTRRRARVREVEIRHG
jgi:hypothetical protein